MVEDGTERVFHEALQEIPDTTGMFETVEVDEGILNISVDGSCTHPSQPNLRVATWGICLADVTSERFFPVGCGGVPGLYQTAVREEITAPVAAFRFGLQQGKLFTIWTDNGL